MATQRKLGRTADQRKALLRNQVTNLIWYGRIETTLARAKEVRSVAEKMITLAIREYDKTVEVQKSFHNDKGQIVEVTVTNDSAEKLAARRIMMSYLYDLKEQKTAEESKSEYKERTKDNKHPVVEKLFRELGPWLYPHVQAGSAPWRRRRDGYHRAGVITAIKRLTEFLSGGFCYVVYLSFAPSFTRASRSVWISSVVEVQSRLQHSAAAVPAAWPSPMHCAITREEHMASRVAEMVLPATKRFCVPLGMSVP